MQKIIPHLWFDKEAKEASAFYVSVFSSLDFTPFDFAQGKSKINNTTTIKDTPSGDCDIVSFDLWGNSFMAISAGPLFKINPAISFSLNLETKEEVQALWDKLAPGAQVLMALDKYPFSDFYGWLNDKYGVSWQLIALGDKALGRPKITPALMFTQERAGKAEEAINFYTSVFRNSKIGGIFRYTASQEPDKEGTIAHSTFFLDGQEFMAFDSAQRHNFSFNEATSLIVNCKDQAEIDYYWEKLSAVPEAEQCGWLKDKYGVSWQIVPEAMNEIMSKGTLEQIDRVTQAFLKMKKFIIADLKKAAEQS